MVLWIELLMREAAVYVIVLMLPLAFAGMVWPARRVWAIRAVELLVALVMSKFAIVAVLSLGGAALASGTSVAGHSVTAALAGVVLLIMGAFTPWALLRLLPLAEVASSAAGSLARETRARAHAGADAGGPGRALRPGLGRGDYRAHAAGRLGCDSRTSRGSRAIGVSTATPATPQGGQRVATRDVKKPLEAQAHAAGARSRNRCPRTITAPSIAETLDVGHRRAARGREQGQVAAVSERLSYRFGPLERRGILGPVRAGQAATIAVGALLAIAILDRRRHRDRAPCSRRSPSGRSCWSRWRPWGAGRPRNGLR